MNTFKKIPATEMSKSKRKLVYGVGVNDSEYNTHSKVNGKKIRCPVYVKWSLMLMRCYCDKFHVTRPTYKDCSVSSDWLFFSSFSKWHDENYTDGYVLDKDLKLKGNRVYSSDNCAYIPACLNSIIICKSSDKLKLPIGVDFEIKRGTFRAKISIDNKQVHIGCFKTKEEAGYAFIEAKNLEIRRKMRQYPRFAKYLVNHLIMV